MRIRAAAIIGLGMTIALGICPAGAQTQTTQSQTGQPRSAAAAVMKGAYETMKAQCRDLAAPYQGGALSGKISITDEPITDAMKANEAVPSEQEAVILRGFIAADAKCASLSLAFARQYMPWDVPTEEYFADAQAPIYAALAARQVSWGKANRDLANLLIHTKELRRLILPKADNGPAFAVAQQEERQKCQAIYAAVSDLTVGGKLVTGQTLTPTLLMNHDRPTEAEATTIRAVRAAHDACGRLTIELTKTYIPWYLPVIEREQDLDDDVYTALADRRISFGEANQRFYDIATRVNQDAKKRVAELAGNAAPTQQATAQQASVQQSSAQPSSVQTASVAQPNAAAKPLTPAQAAFQEADRRCKEVVAPFRTGPIGGKIRMTHENVTQAMMENSDTPTEAEAAALSDFAGAHTLCQALETRFIAQYMAFMMPVHDKEVQRERAVFDALIARKSSYGEANRKLKEIEQDAIAEGDKLIQARKAGGGEMQAFSQMLQPPGN